MKHLTLAVVAILFAAGCCNCKCGKNNAVDLSHVPDSASYITLQIDTAKRAWAKGGWDVTAEVDGHSVMVYQATFYSSGESSTAQRLYVFVPQSIRKRCGTRLEVSARARHADTGEVVDMGVRSVEVFTY